MSDKEQFFVLSQSTAAKAADDFVFNPEALEKQGGAAAIGADVVSLATARELAETVWDFVDLLAASRLEHLEGMMVAFLDGIALGATERTLPDAEELPGLAGELAASLEGNDEATAAFDLGRELGKSLGDFGVEDALGLSDAEGTGDLPDLAGLGEGEAVPSALDLFSQTQDVLHESLGAAVDHPSLMGSGRGFSGTESAETSEKPAEAAPTSNAEPTPNGSSGAGTITEETSDGAYGDAAVIGASAAIVTAAVAIGVAVAAPAAAATVGLTLVGVSAGMVAVAAAAHVHDVLGHRPTGDGPAAEETEVTFEDFLAAVVQRAGGLVLTEEEDLSALRPEDMEAFQRDLMQAVWESVSRPGAGGGSADGDDGNGGLDPEDLQHKLDPEEIGPSPLPEGINPQEPLDPTGGEGTGLVVIAPLGGSLAEDVGFVL